MKRFIVIIAILALFIPGLVDALQLTQGWDEDTISAGAHVSNTTGAFQHLDQRTLNERWDVDPSDSSVWGDIITSNGAINVNEDGVPVSHMELDKVDATSIAVRFLKQTIDITQPFRIKIVIRESFFSTTHFQLMLSGYSADPTADDLGNRLTFNFLYATNVVRIHYFTPGSVQTEWDGSNWLTGTRTVPFLENDWNTVYLISDGTSWHIELDNEDGSQQTSTTPVTWANTKALGGGESAYLVLGDNLDGGSTLGDVSFVSVEMWSTEAATTYLTSAQIINTDTITFEEDFNSEDIQVLVGNTPVANTEFKVSIQEDAGVFSSAINVNTTILAGETGWHDFMPGTAFTNHSTITAQLELNTGSSDNQLQAYAVKVKGVTIAGGGQEGITGGMGL